MKFINSILNEANVRWALVSHDSHVLGQDSGGTDTQSTVSNRDCSVMPVTLYLNDHKATTLTSVINAVKAYKTDHPKLPIGLAVSRASSSSKSASRRLK